MRQFYRFFAFNFLMLMPTISVSAQSGEHLVPPLLPENNEITGWERDGEVYLAHDEGSLAEYINGAAPFYIEHGAIEIGFQDYASGDTFLYAEIYRMEEARQAEKLMADIEADDPEPLTTINGEGRFVGGYIGVLQIEFWQEEYFVRLNVSSKSEKAKADLLSFAEGVSNRIAELSAD